MKTPYFNLFIAVFSILLFSCEKSSTKNCTSAPVIKAGNDTTVINATKLQLNGISDSETASWRIISGEGGTIDSLSGNTLTGILGNSYKLLFESSNSCGTASDTLLVTFSDSIITASNMISNIHWITQSAFRIQTPKVKIYIDPQNITTADEADIVLVTHAHGDHYSTADIKKLCGAKTIYIAPADCNYTGVTAKRIILLPDSIYKASNNVEIKAVPAYNVVKTDKHPKSKNWVGYVITINGVKIYHAGDTERVPEMKTFECDIAMLPLGQTYTMQTVADAAEAAKDVKAKYAIPMHFGTGEGNATDAQTFKTLLNGSGITVVIKTKGE